MIIVNLVVKMSESERKTFSPREKILLVNLINSYKHIVENKQTDCVSLRKKNEAWEKVCGLYNAHDVTKRTTKQLKKLWDNIKQKYLYFMWYFFKNVDVFLL